MPSCSVIVPVYNLAEVTRRCLDRLLDGPAAARDAELIVVDDGSRDGTPGLLAGYGDRIRVVTHPRNLGFATACNDGAAVAAGELLVFLNNDTLPLPGWLDALVAYAAARPAAGAVGAKLLYPDGTVQHAGMVITPYRDPLHLYVGFPADHPAVNKSRRFQMVTGACLLAPRAAFAAAGGFDPAFVNGFEDADLCLRLGELGYEVHYCHDSVLVHLESVSQGRTDREDANHRLFLGRWGDRVRVDDWLYYLEDGLVRVEYAASCPARFHVAPILGAVHQDGRQAEADRLLAWRARQVRDLLRENVGLRLGRPPAATPG